MGGENVSQEVVDYSALQEVPQKSDKSTWAIIGIFAVIIVTASIVFFLMLSFDKDSGVNSQIISDEEISNGTNFILESNIEVLFNLSEEEHQLVLDAFDNDSVDITISSRPMSLNIKIGETKKVDLDGDGKYDILIKFVEIRDGKPLIYIKKIEDLICTEKWNCTEWGDCLNEIQERVCNDLNHCNTLEDKPNEVKECGVICVENWSCSTWSTCINNTQTRTCRDLNSCGLDNNKSNESRTCKSLTPIKWTCEDDLKDLIVASEDCIQASANLTVTVDLFGVEHITTAYYKIYGKEKNDCIFSLRLDQKDMKYSDELVHKLLKDNLSLKEINLQEKKSKDLANSLVGRDSGCKVSPENLTIFLSKMCDGNISGGVSCSFVSEDSNCIYSEDWGLFNDCEGGNLSTEISNKTIDSNVDK